MLEKYLRDALMIWATIDPIGTLSLFAAVTAGLTAQERRKTAFKAIGYSAIILVCAIIIGQLLLTAMDIKLKSLQVAGGLILLILALQMIFGLMDRSSAERGHDLAVFPLAIPSIASPGAIMAVILLTDYHIYSIPQQTITALIMLGILLITYLLLRAADPIMRIIGKNGAAILIRIMGMILAALSVELIMDALNLPGWG